MGNYLKILSMGGTISKRKKRSKFAKIFLRGVSPQFEFDCLYLVKLIKLFIKNNHNLSNFDKEIKAINIYDIGCGPCSYFFSNTFKGFKLNYTGIDINYTFKDHIEKFGGSLIKANLENKLSMIESNTANIIICSHVIEHIKNTESFISEMYRILSPKGLIFIRTPDIEKVKFEFFDDYTHVRPYTPNSLKCCLLSSNFEVIYSKSITPLKSVSEIIIKNLPIKIERILLYFFGFLSLFIFRKRREVELLATKHVD